MPFKYKKWLFFNIKCFAHHCSIEIRPFFCSKKGTIKSKIKYFFQIKKGIFTGVPYFFALKMKNELFSPFSYGKLVLTRVGEING